MKNGGAGHMPGVGKVKAYSRNDLSYLRPWAGPSFQVRGLEEKEPQERG